MLVLCWVLFLLMSAAFDLSSVAPVTAAEAAEKGEEVLHGIRLRRPGSVRTRDARDVRDQRVRPALAPERARRAAQRPEPAYARVPFLKRPPSGPEPGSSVDDH